MNRVWTDQRWNLKEQHGKETKSQCLLPGFSWQIIFLPSHPSFQGVKGEFLHIWLSVCYCARGVIFINSPNVFSFVHCGHFVENINFWSVTEASDVGIPPQAWKFPLKGIQTDAAFLHQVFQTLQFDTDASLSVDKVPVWVLMQETRRPILRRGSVFSLQFMKQKIWGVVAK